MKNTLRLNKFGSVVLLSGAVLALSGCGASVPATTSTPTTSADSAVSSGSTASSYPLTLQASAASVAEAGTVQFTASGGVPPYTYSNPSGVGILSSAGSYTAPSEAITIVIEVTDANQNQASATVTVVAPSSTTPTTSSLTLVSTSSMITPGEQVPVIASGGEAPYVFSVVVGQGSLSTTGYTSDSTDTYDSSSLDSTVVEIKVSDSSSTPESAYLVISVTAASAPVVSTSDPLSAGINVLVDDMLGVTFYSNPEYSSPALIFFGTGSKPTEVTMFAHTAVDQCGYDMFGNTLAPCTVQIPLTNYTSSNTYATTYEGTITYQGRSGGGSATFCIPPGSYPTQAYLLPGSVSGSAGNEQFLQMSYNDQDDGRALLNGVPVLSFLSETDTNGGAGYTSVGVQADFTSHTSCASYGSQTITVL